MCSVFLGIVCTTHTKHLLIFYRKSRKKRCVLPLKAHETRWTQTHQNAEDPVNKLNFRSNNIGAVHVNYVQSRWTCLTWEYYKAMWGELANKKLQTTNFDTLTVCDYCVDETSAKMNSSIESLQTHVIQNFMEGWNRAIKHSCHRSVFLFIFSDYLQCHETFTTKPKVKHARKREKETKVATVCMRNAT